MPADTKHPFLRGAAASALLGTTLASTLLVVAILLLPPAVLQLVEAIVTAITVTWICCEWVASWMLR